MQKLGFPQEWKEELKSKNDIISVVSKYVHLQQKGKRFWGCCPFHIEKTPSFSVNPETGLFHCYGCKEAGDVISFVQKIERIDFPKSIELLASWSGMQVPSFEGNEDIMLRAKKKEKILLILEETKQFFISNLDKPNAKQAMEYIARRSLTRENLKKFEIGVSLDWSGLVNFLKNKGYTIEEMKEAGVAEIKDGHAYDVMAERLAFPIFNSLGECIAFSARILIPSDFAKYKNTADTMVFNKSRAVFGINLIKKLKHEKGLKNIIVVEGQMDVIAMHQAGFENTVACMGTALTPEHGRELKKFSENIVLCFDGDSAGKKATLRSIDVLKAEGLNVKVASISSGGKDPDEYIKANGVEAMQQILNEALPATDYKIVSLSTEFDLKEPSENAKYVAKAMEIVNSLPSNAEKDIYLKLINKVTNVPIDILRRDLNSVKSAIKSASSAEAVFKLQSNDPISESIKFVLSANLNKKEYANIPEKLGELLTSNEERIVFDYVVQCQRNNRKPFVGAVFELFDNDNEFAKSLVAVNFDSEDFDGPRHYDACMWTVVESNLKKQQQDLLSLYKTESSQDQRKEIMEKINQIAQNLKKKNWREILC